MAYQCEDQLTRQTLLQYIHQNRHHNSLRINTMGETLFEFCRLKPYHISRKIYCTQFALPPGNLIQKLEENYDKKLKDQELKINIEMTGEQL